MTDNLTFPTQLAHKALEALRATEESRIPMSLSVPIHQALEIAESLWDCHIENDSKASILEAERTYTYKHSKDFKLQGTIDLAITHKSNKRNGPSTTIRDWKVVQRLPQVKLDRYCASVQPKLLRWLYEWNNTPRKLTFEYVFYVVSEQVIVVQKVDPVTFKIKDLIRDFTRDWIVPKDHRNLTACMAWGEKCRYYEICHSPNALEQLNSLDLTDSLPISQSLYEVNELCRAKYLQLVTEAQAKHNGDYHKVSIYNRYTLLGTLVHKALEVAYREYNGELA